MMINDYHKEASRIYRQRLRGDIPHQSCRLNMPKNLLLFDTIGVILLGIKTQSKEYVMNAFSNDPSKEHDLRIGVDPGQMNGDKTAVAIYTKCPEGVSVVVRMENFTPIMDGLLARQLPRWSKMKRLIYYSRRFVSRIPVIKRLVTFSKYEGLSWYSPASMHPPYYNVHPLINPNIPEERAQHGQNWVSVNPAISGMIETVTIWDGQEALDTRCHVSEGPRQMVEWIIGLEIVDKNIDILVNVVGVGRAVHEHLLKLGYNSIQTNPAKDG